MIELRRVHAAAAIVHGLAIGAVLLRLDRVAIALLIFSATLLIWSIEKLRVAITRETVR